MSLFWRLWFSLALAFGLLTIALGLGEYSTLRRTLLNEVDRNLEVRALWLSHELQAGQLPEGLMVPPRQSLEELGKVFVEILDDRGQLVRRSSNLDSQSLPGESRPGTFFGTVSTPEGHPFRLHQLQLPGSQGYIRVGESMELAESSLGKSVVRILALGALTCLLAAFFCFRVLERICRPLEALSRKAQAIAESGEVRLRLPVESSVREVGQVSSTINVLLERVENLLEAQERLLQDTSHELRNPLTVLKMDLELLAKPDLDSETRQEVSQEAQGELSRLVGLVEGLMLISWAETHPQIELQALELAPLVDQLLSRYNGLKGDRQIDLHLPACSVLADPARLEQILRNLLDNAFRYAGEQARLRLSLAEPGDWIPAEVLRCGAEEVVLVVQDDGPGIDEKFWEKLFERYFRLEPDRNRQAGGVGLGLPLARALARAMGGDLTVYSQPGRGCAFLLRLRAPRALEPLSVAVLTGERTRLRPG